MKRNKTFAAVLAISIMTSTTAMAAKKDAETGAYNPGGYFNCLIPNPGPKGFRTGGCWLDGATGGY